MSGPTTRQMSVGAVNLAWADLGAGPPVLMLHGFPDIATTFLPLAELLGDRGYRCVIPWSRGYWPSTAADYYDIGSLIADALAVMRELDLERPFVVGHDWGADVAYGLAAARPSEISAIVAMATPHDSALGPNRLASFDQLRRSFYEWLFQIPEFSDHLLAANDFAFLRRLWQEWSPEWTPPSEHLEAVIESIRRGGTSGPLNYYRAMFDTRLHDPATADLRADARRPIESPTLFIGGDQDGCIDASMAIGAEHAFNGPYEREVLTACGHFPHLEHPETVADLTVDWFTRHASP